MKKLLIAAAVAAIMSTGAAQAADQNINLNATVATFCTIAGLPGTAAAVAIDLGDTATGATADLAAGSTTVNLGQIICNAPATSSLASAKGALLVGTGAATVAGFQNYIGYSATTAGLPDAQASVAANVTTGTVTATAGTPASHLAAFQATPAVNVTVTPATALLAGEYEDTLTFTINPT